MFFERIPHVRKVGRLIGHLLDFFLPTACSYCNAPVVDSGIPFFCSACWADFLVMTSPFCQKCGRPFDSPEALSHSPDHCCMHCRKDPPLFDQALSVGLFEGPLREAIHQFKYRPCGALAMPLARWMTDNLKSIDGVDVIMPIPLHSLRLRQRGFNQSLLLAHQLAVTFSIPLSYDNLLRVIPTKPQVELSGEQRIKNVKNAFALARPEEISGRSILLVDDVFTTGATVNECTKVLRESGSTVVRALTIARAQ